MKCADCGYENDDDAKFCEKCGNALARVCSNCNSPIKPGASFCKECGTPVPQKYLAEGGQERLAILQQSAPSDLKEKIRTSSTQIEGERKPVTILFTDIVGSTSLAEKLDPEEWKEIVSTAHQRISQMVYKYEGTIAQLLGDGVLAFFGAPVTHEDDPIRAVHAALDIQQEIGKYADELKGYIGNFQLRVGLNTGTVVVGNVGSDLHMEYLAIGDAVNLAARLQSAAQPGKVLISESTARQVKAMFNLQPMGQITVKGKSEPVTVFEVINRKAIPERSRGFTDLSSPLVGRSCELASLNELLDALLNGHGQIVAIIGEAGIGKSRLVAEVRQQSSGRSPQAHWIEGRALSYGQTLSFWTITQLLYRDLGLSDGDPEVKVRTALKRRLNALFGENDIEVLPYLAHLLGVRLEGEIAERVRLLEGETLRRQTLLAIGRYFQRLAEKQPTVAVFEDMHWADSSSLEALEALLAVTDRAPLMLVFLSRLEREHGSWRIKVKAETDFYHRYTEIPLKPLSTSEQNRLVDNLLAIADLPDSTRRLILERTEGNPFYLEEIIRSLIDQGAIVHEEDRWRATRDLTDLTIPETLEGVLLARIDRLQEDVRRTLQMASVIGKSFLYRLLEAIATAEQQLDQQLAQLQRVDLVREKNRLPELEYIFKHSLTQEAAYNSLLMEQRREFHRRVGEALENLFSDRIEQYLGLMAHHFESSRDFAKAVGYLIQAGDRARLTDEHTEAIGYYQRAVKLLEDQHEENRLAQVWLKLGLIYNANFQFEAAHQANEKAFALQQKMLPHKQPARTAKPYLFRFGFSGAHVSLDPGLASWGQDVATIVHLFSGLASINEELDMVPAVARSWQVLDNGRRYIFHLRNDVAWTDGTPVTAGDFEWAWKRNLHPDLHSGTAGFLFDVLGAREYHEGVNRDPASVGVRALDGLTLEVQLEQPVAYFPFIVTMPVTFPLPRKIVEEFGKTWWQPGTIVGNGPYRLEKFDPQHGGILERNSGYYGDFPGNAEQVEWTIFPNEEEMFQAYIEGRIEYAFYGNRKVPGVISREEIHENQQLGVSFLVFSPTEAPFNDLRVRKAFGLTYNRQRFFDQFTMPICRGGLVPPGMPGHSPDINLPYDVTLARRLMSEAGYPGGKGFPAVKGIGPQGGASKFAELVRQWREALGVEIVLEETALGNLTDWKKENASHILVMNGWQADYPDPDNILWKSDAIDQLKRLGWHDPAYDRLVEGASRTPDRVKRLAMYRQADRLLVAEQALVLPIFYFLGRELIKPWVKNFKENLLGMIYLHQLIIQDH
jgi:ABC-type oligopeptide transport system substrate-binding subunit/class 3 adenylate cyclase